MSHEIMIPDSAELPAHIVNRDVATKANASIIAGIGEGMHPRIKMSGKQFVLIDGNGEEMPIPNGKLFKADDDNLYLRTVFLGAKPELQKRWYATKYDPNKEGSAPDCFSNDGVKPDPSIPKPQCETCAKCPHNAFGSGVTPDGQATGGKACTDNKILAVFVPPFKKGDAAPGVFELKITPASLKNLRLYVNALDSKGIMIGNVFTLVTFVDNASFPILTFQYGGPVPEGAVDRFAELSQSPETNAIVNQKITWADKGGSEAPAKPAPKQEAAPKKEEKVEEEPAAEEPAQEELSVDDVRASLGL